MLYLVSNLKKEAQRLNGLNKDAKQLSSSPGPKPSLPFPLLQGGSLSAEAITAVAGGVGSSQGRSEGPPWRGGPSCEW